MLVRPHTCLHHFQPYLRGQKQAGFCSAPEVQMTCPVDTLLAHSSAYSQFFCSLGHSLVFYCVLWGGLGWRSEVLTGAMGGGEQTTQQGPQEHLQGPQERLLTQADRWGQVSPREEGSFPRGLVGG